MNHTIVNLQNKDGFFSLPMSFNENVEFTDGSVHRLHEPLSHVGATKCSVIFTNRGCEGCSKTVVPDGPIAELTTREVTCDTCKKYL